MTHQTTEQIEWEYQRALNATMPPMGAAAIHRWWFDQGVRAALLDEDKPAKVEQSDRDAFEKFYVRSNRRGVKHAVQALARNEHGDYVDDSAQRHWWTWQNAVKAADLLAEDKAGGEPVKFLANATRYKVSMLHGGAGSIMRLPQELCGRWVALVAADDDCHLKYTHTQLQAERVPLTDEQIEAINVSFAGRRDLARMFARAIESAHGIGGKE